MKKNFFNLSIVLVIFLAFNAFKSNAQAGSIGGFQTLCGGSTDPYPINNIANATGSGVYSWQLSKDNGLSWLNISGATGLSYDPPAGVISPTMYRRRFTRTTFPFSTLYTSPVIVNVCNYYNNYSDAAGTTCAPNPIIQVNTGVSVSNGATQFAGSGNDGRVYTQHGMTLANAWRLDFNFNYSSFAFTDPNSPRDLSRNLIALTGNNGKIFSSSIANPGISAMLEDMSPNNNMDKPYFQISASTKNIGSHSMIGWQPNPNTDYYISLFYVNKKVFYVAYSDKERTTKIALFTGTADYNSSTPNIQVLPYLQHGGMLAHDGGNLNGSLDNTCLSNLNANCAGVISGNTTIACGSTSPITISSDSPFYIGGRVPFSYQWQYLSGTQWINTGSGAASLTLTSPPLVTTRYRRAVFINVDYPAGGTSFYFPLTSNEVTVTVTPPGYSFEPTYYPDGEAYFRFVPSAPGTYIEHSSDNVNWTTSGNSSDGSYEAGVMYPNTRNIYIRAKNSCSASASDYYQLAANPIRIMGPESSAESNEFSIYPNPNNGVFDITFSNDEVKDLYVYDIMGKVVVTEKAIKERIINIDIHSLPKGIYMVKVISANNSKVTRVVVE